MILPVTLHEYTQRQNAGALSAEYTCYQRMCPGGAFPEYTKGMVYSYNKARNKMFDDRGDLKCVSANDLKNPEFWKKLGSVAKESRGVTQVEYGMTLTEYKEKRQKGGLSPKDFRYFVRSATAPDSSKWKKYIVYRWHISQSVMGSDQGWQEGIRADSLGSLHYWVEVDPENGDIVDMMSEEALIATTNKKELGMKVEKNVILVDGINIKKLCTSQLMNKMEEASSQIKDFNNFEQLSKKISTESYVNKSIVKWQDIFDTLEAELNTRDPEKAIEEQL